MASRAKSRRRVYAVSGFGTKYNVERPTSNVEVGAALGREIAAGGIAFAGAPGSGRSKLNVERWTFVFVFCNRNVLLEPTILCTAWRLRYLGPSEQRSVSFGPSRVVAELLTHADLRCFVEGF